MVCHIRCPCRDGEQQQLPGGTHSDTQLLLSRPALKNQALISPRPRPTPPARLGLPVLVETF